VPKRKKSRLITFLIVLFILILLLALGWWGFSKVKQQIELKEKDREENFADWIFGSFSDMFSGQGYVDIARTTMKLNKITTAYTFPVKYDWKKIKTCVEKNCGLNTEDELKKCVGNNCLEKKDNEFYYNGKLLPLPKEFKVKNLIDLTFDTLKTKWIIGAVIKRNKDEYQGVVYVFNGQKFSAIVDERNESFISKYPGTFGSGGDDDDFLIIYGAYQGLGYRYKDGEMIDLSNYFGIRQMNNGFRGKVIKIGRGDSTTWYIYSLTPGNPQLIKFWQNKTDNIEGSYSYNEEIFNPNTLQAIFQPDKNNEELNLLSIINDNNTYELWQFTDIGFVNNFSKEVVSLNFYSNSALDIKKVLLKNVWLNQSSLLATDFYISTDGLNWQEASINQESFFDGPRDNSLFWKALFKPAANRYYSPNFDFLGIDYFYK